MTRNPGANLGRATSPGDSPISGDLPCASCGYNLRGLAGDGRCPECGLETVLSLKGELLPHAEVPWLEHLYLGQTLIQIASILGTIVSFILVTTLPGFNVTSLPGVRWMRSSHAILTIMIYFALPFITWITFLIGVLLSTSPEPRVRNLEPPRTARRLTRIMTLVLLCTASVGWILPNLPLRVSAVLALTPAWTTGIQVILLIMTFVVLVGLLWHMTDLSRRLDTSNGKLTKQLLQLRRYIMLFGIGSMPFVFLPPPSPMGPSRWYVNLLAFAWLFFLAFLWLGMWAIRLNGEYRQALRDALQKARNRQLVESARRMP